jgi:hypothetical protein
MANLKVIFVAVTILCLTAMGYAEQDSDGRKDKLIYRETKSTESVKNQTNKVVSSAQIIEIVKQKIVGHKLNNKFHFSKENYAEDDVVALGKISGGMSVPVLEQIITTYPSVVVKLNSLEALGMLLNTDIDVVSEIIKKALKDPNIMVRGKAAHILAKTQNKDAVTALIQIALTNPDSLDKDVLEDELYHSEFYVLRIYQTQGMAAAININPNIKTVNQSYFVEWDKRYRSLKERIITGSINDLVNYNNSEVRNTLKHIASYGVTENIKKSAAEVLKKIN